MVKRTERLQGSKNRRDDEYYTLYDDIAAEVRHYLPQLRGKSLDPKRRFTQDDKDHLLSEMTPDADGLYECAICHQHFAPEELQVDHKTAWSLGGRTVLSNAQLLCSACNSRKSNK